MLSDAAALGLSFLALKFGEKKATLSKTFGYRRFEILAAFINGLTLIVISLYIFWEASRRILAPPDVISQDAHHCFRRGIDQYHRGLFVNAGRQR